MDKELYRIVTITKDYITEEKFLELIIKLDNDVGKVSENEIIKKFLSSIRQYIDKPLPPPSLWLWTAFYLLVVLHIILVIMVIASFFVLAFAAPWYIALPVMTFIWFFATTKVECQLTNLENFLRRKLGLKRIGGFVGFYFIKPIKRLF